MLSPGLGNAQLSKGGVAGPGKSTCQGSGFSFQTVTTDARIWGAAKGQLRPPGGRPSWSSRLREAGLHQAPGAAGVAPAVQQGAGWAELVRVIVRGWGRGQRRLVDDLDRGTRAAQRCGAAGIRGGRGVAGESLAQQGLHARQAGLVQDNDLDNLLALHQGAGGCGRQRWQRQGLLSQRARLWVWQWCWCWSWRSPLGPQPGVVLGRLKPVVN